MPRDIGSLASGRRYPRPRTDGELRLAEFAAKLAIAKGVCVRDDQPIPLLIQITLDVLELQVICDLKDQALAHFRAGKFTANSAPTVIAAPTRTIASCQYPLPSRLRSARNLITHDSAESQERLRVALNAAEAVDSDFAYRGGVAELAIIRWLSANKQARLEKLAATMPEIWVTMTNALADIDLQDKICEQFTVVRHELFSGALVPLRNGTVIVENDSHSDARRRSTMGHELAHVLGEHKFGASLVNERGCRLADQSQEAEAAEIGGELLIPFEAAKQLARREATNEEVACQFGVSVEMARWRMDATGARLIAARQFAAYQRARTG